MAYGIQHSYLYDAYGHLKHCQEALQDKLAARTKKDGISVQCKCGWASEATAQAAVRQTNNGLQCSQQQQQLQPIFSMCQPNIALDSEHGLTQQYCCSSTVLTNCTGLQPVIKGTVTPQRVSLEKAASFATASHSNKLTGGDCRGAHSPAASVRLLSAEDAYAPVIAAILARSRQSAAQISCRTDELPSSAVLEAQYCNIGPCRCPSSHTGQEPPGNCCCEYRVPSAAAATCDVHVRCDAHCDEEAYKPPSVSHCSCQQTHGPGSCLQQHDTSSMACSFAHCQCHSSLATAAANERQLCLARGEQSSYMPQQHHVLATQHQLAVQQQQPAEHSRKTAVLEAALHHHHHGKQGHAHQGSLLPELASIAGLDILEEPQLLLVFGPVLTLAGFPPFHTRACEVQHLGPLAQANRQAVADAIIGYCKVLQRHGA
eukprot:GHRR01026018.1.p1 GENE.GHRR01026018.1~~GHRR01026018.1.p1  ORF type:complete len:430 (+),score=146.75 GHRR01026018.1:878-2167(+)